MHKLALNKEGWIWCIIIKVEGKDAGKMQDHAKSNIGYGDE